MRQQLRAALGLVLATSVAFGSLAPMPVDVRAGPPAAAQPEGLSTFGAAAASLIPSFPLSADSPATATAALPAALMPTATPSIAPRERPPLCPRY